MALYVGLGQYIHAVFVAQVIEHRVVGVVGCTYGVDIQSFHAQNILLNLLGSDGTSVDWREVVTVYAVEHHALTVDQQRTIAGDGHLAEANLATTDINHLAPGILQCQHQVVEVGLFGAPFPGIRHVHIQTDVGGLGFEV